MHLVDWLIIACVTLFAIINGVDYFLWNERKRSELLIYGTLSVVFGLWLISEDKFWASAYCVALANAQFVLGWRARKKSETS